MEYRIKPFEVQYESVPPLPSASIWLCHPGYPDSLTPHVIARIPCFDQDSTGEWGVHHGTLRTIAFILSGNRPGKLVPRPQSSESSMSDIDSLTDDAILLGTQYYYFPSDWNMAEEGPYGIVKSFHDYRFPHGNLPGAWALLTQAPDPLGRYAPSNFSGAVRSRDVSCRLSGTRDGLEVSHLIPKTEGAWVC